MIEERRRFSSPVELQSALEALDGNPVRVSCSDWPGPPHDLDASGLYSWWVDENGADALFNGLGQSISAGRIYSGQAGATSWPSGIIEQFVA